MNRPIARPVASAEEPADQAGYGVTNNDSLTPNGMFVRRPGGRITSKYVEQLACLLGERHQQIINDLARVRVLSGDHLDRLHFASLSPPHRARSRVMTRLTRLRVVTTLDRRVGGVRAGSAGLIYTLDIAGQRLLQLLSDGQPHGTARRPWTPGAPFVAHTLDASELYVQLREVERRGDLELVNFLAEPACWQRTSTLGTIKPDGFVLVAHGDVEDAWWLEVDRGTESPNTLRRKLELYLLAAQTGQVGPSGVLPRVLVTVPDAKRLDQVEAIIDTLAGPANRLLAVARHDEAVSFVARVLRE